jgi:hypothetical protein
MKRNLKGRRVEVQTPSGPRAGEVIKQFTEHFGINSGKCLVTVILEGGDLNNYENEITCNVDTIKMLD